MKLNKLDYFIIFLALLCIIIGGIYTFHHEKMVAPRDTILIGHVQEGQGSRKLASSLQWFSITKGEKVYYGDKVFSNENKDLIVQIQRASSPDKVGDLTIPKNSLVKITDEKGSLGLDTQKGKIQFSQNSINEKLIIINNRGV